MVILLANEDTLKSFKAPSLISDICGGCGTPEGIGLISLYGAIGTGFWSSDITYTQIEAMIESLINDEKIKSIIIKFNSPGGAVAGLFECCDYIKNASKIKPIMGYIEGECCSASYALASSCSFIGASDGSITGCCGAYAHVIEESDEVYKKEGLLHRIFRSKNAPKKNLSIVNDEETAEAFQKQVDECGDKYLALVMENRGLTDPIVFGEGREMLTSEALNRGLIDKICAIEDVVNLSPSMDEEIDMDLSKLSEEEKRELLDELLKEFPDVLKEKEDEGKTEERERIDGLNSLRNGISAVDDLINSAIKNGKTANEIIGSCYSLTNEHKKTSLDSLVSATTEVNTPSAVVTDKEEIDKFFKAVKEMK